jgi:ABC-2 type transport system ATP-binding protein
MTDRSNRSKSCYGSERILQVEFEHAIPIFTLEQAELKRSEGRKKWFAFNRLTTPVSGLIASRSARSIRWLT